MSVLINAVAVLQKVKVICCPPVRLCRVVCGFVGVPCVGEGVVVVLFGFGNLTSWFAFFVGGI